MFQVKGVLGGLLPAATRGSQRARGFKFHLTCSSDQMEHSFTRPLLFNKAGQCLLIETQLTEQINTSVTGFGRTQTIQIYVLPVSEKKMEKENAN